MPVQGSNTYLVTDQASVTTMASTRYSAHSRVGELEIRFPACAVARQFPAAHDRAAVGSDRSRESLRESRGVAPEPPHIVSKADLVFPRHPALVKIEHRAFSGRVVAAED